MRMHLLIQKGLQTKRFYAIKELEDPVYSSDRAMCDFWLFFKQESEWTSIEF